MGDTEDSCVEVHRSGRRVSIVVVRTRVQRGVLRGGSFLLQRERGSVIGGRPLGSACYCQAGPMHTHQLGGIS